jgi:hypothetical protein
MSTVYKITGQLVVTETAQGTNIQLMLDPIIIPKTGAAGPLLCDPAIVRFGPPSPMSPLPAATAVGDVKGSTVTIVPVASASDVKSPIMSSKEHVTFLRSKFNELLDYKSAKYPNVIFNKRLFPICNISNCGQRNCTYIHPGVDCELGYLCKNTSCAKFHRNTGDCSKGSACKDKLLCRFKHTTIVRKAWIDEVFEEYCNSR